MNNLVVIPIEELQQKIEQAVNKALKENAPDEILTTQQVADLFKVDRSTIYQWKQAGKLIPHGMGRKVYYLRSEVFEAVTQMRAA